MVSAFRPDNFAEVKLLFKPLRRRPILRKGDTSGLGSKTRLSASGPRKTALQGRPRKKKKLTDGELKKLVWKEFSIFIRTRGARLDGTNRCTTCGVQAHWKTLHAGHFIRGRLNANLFDERGCHPQCYHCNVGRQGDVVIYYKWMLKEYGQEVIDELIAQNGKTRKWKLGELAEMLAHYKGLNAENPLVNQNGGQDV